MHLPPSLTFLVGRRVPTAAAADTSGAGAAAAAGGGAGDAAAAAPSTTTSGMTSGIGELCPLPGFHEVSRAHEHTHSQMAC